MQCLSNAPSIAPSMGKRLPARVNWLIGIIHEDAKAGDRGRPVRRELLRAGYPCLCVCTEFPYSTAMVSQI
jgi:hypothetical protein